MGSRIRLPEYVEEGVRVSEWSTVRVKHCAYSVPSRLKGEWVRVRLYEDKLEICYAGKLQLTCERLLGRNQRRIDYRHAIWSLMRKPGGFARYVCHEEMFPQPVFRAAYDAIQAAQPGTKGDVTYLRTLHLAASTLAADVAAALAHLQTTGTPVTVDAVKALAAPSSSSIAVPELTGPLTAELDDAGGHLVALREITDADGDGRIPMEFQFLDPRESPFWLTLSGVITNPPTPMQIALDSSQAVSVDLAVVAIAPPPQP